MLFPETVVVNTFFDYIKTALLPVEGFREMKLGVFPKTKRKVGAFIRRGESLAEHQAKTAFLARLFIENFPEFFDLNGLSQDEVLNLVTYPLIRNVGQIKTGNIVKDGRRVNDKVKEAVYLRFSEFTKLGFPNSNAAVDYSRYYKEEEAKTGEFGQAFAALSLLEHTLTLAYLRYKGISGSIAKKPYLTVYVKNLIRQTGTKDAFEIFAADLIRRVRNYPEHIKKPIYFVLEHAAVYATGTFLKWWDWRKDENQLE